MITVTFTYHHLKRRVQKSGITALIKKIWKEESVSDGAHFHFVFVDDPFMLSLNKKYFKKLNTTDVIAFDLSDDSERFIEGEIYINLDQAAKQAHENSVTFTNEAMRLAAHGCLHFMGYDDHRPEDRNKMIERGEYYLNQMKQS